jgi:hypothetical protein
MKFKKSAKGTVGKSHTKSGNDNNKLEGEISGEVCKRQKSEEIPTQELLTQPPDATDPMTVESSAPSSVETQEQQPNSSSSSQPSTNAEKAKIQPLSGNCPPSKNCLHEAVEKSVELRAAENTFKQILQTFGKDKDVIDFITFVEDVLVTEFKLSLFGE